MNDKYFNVMVKSPFKEHLEFLAFCRTKEEAEELVLSEKKKEILIASTMHDNGIHYEEVNQYFIESMPYGM